MAKKALVSTNEFRGPTGTEGHRVLEVVEAGSEFEVCPENLEWKDCGDDVTSFVWWYRTSDNTFKKLPEAVDPPELAVDANNVPTQTAEWNWETEQYDITDI